MPKIPSPLEGADAVGDSALEIVATAPRIVRNVTGAISNAAGNIDRDLAVPRNEGDIPPSPFTLVGTVVNVVVDGVSGTLGAVKGVFDGVGETYKGVTGRIGRLR